MEFIFTAQKYKKERGSRTNYLPIILVCVACAFSEGWWMQKRVHTKN
jgi:hypothetical protein